MVETINVLPPNDENWADTITLGDLFLPYIHDTNRASDPVEEVTDIMEKWFDRLEDGTAKNFYPNPKGMKVSPAEADRIIKYIDFEINFELRVYTAWHGNRGHDYPAEYDRLPGVARIAFAQEILEAKERLGIPRGKQTQSQEEEPTGFGGL